MYINGPSKRRNANEATNNITVVPRLSNELDEIEKQKIK
jgi:hypothetical protein